MNVTIYIILEVLYKHNVLELKSDNFKISKNFKVKLSYRVND